MAATQNLDELITQEYRHGFVTDIEADTVPQGLNEDIVRLISAKKNEPEFMLEWRLKAYRHWLTMTEPHVAERALSAHRLPGHHLLLGAEDRRAGPKSLDEVDPELLRDLREARHPAARARDAWPAWRWMRCSTAFRWRPRSRTSWPRRASSSARSPKRCTSIRSWCRSTSGSVVPYTDNFFAALNSAVFTDGSFCYIPQGRALPDGAVHLFPHQRARTPASSSAR